MRGSFLALLVLSASLGNTIAAPAAVTAAPVARRDVHAPAPRTLVQTVYAKRGDNNNADGGPGGSDDCANGGPGGSGNQGGFEV